MAWYLVKGGDSLAKIARVVLGDERLEHFIFNANPWIEKDPRVTVLNDKFGWHPPGWWIFPGQKLWLP